jgi:hypothetical protein
MKVGKSASWSKWWCVKNTEFISVGDIPALISFQVVAGPQSKSNFSPPMSMTYEDPKRSGNGVGVPQPMIVISGLLLLRLI